MKKIARSARGQMVDFELLAIKQQLATVPVTTGTNDRRKFIDEKDGIKVKPGLAPAPQPVAEASDVAGMMSLTLDSLDEMVDTTTE